MRTGRLGIRAPRFFGRARNNSNNDAGLHITYRLCWLPLAVLNAGLRCGDLEMVFNLPEGMVAVEIRY